MYKEPVITCSLPSLARYFYRIAIYCLRTHLFRYNVCVKLLFYNKPKYMFLAFNNKIIL